MNTSTTVPPPRSDFDVDDPNLTRFDLVREGARRDGVEIVHYEPRFPEPGTKAEKRVERSIALLFAVSGLAAFGFVVAYIWWPWQYQDGTGLSKIYTPLLGLLLGVALFALGIGIAAWAKKLLPEEVSVQDRHDGPSPHDEQQLTGSTLVNMVDALGIKRRPMIKAALALPVAGLGLAGGAVVLGSLIKDPDQVLFHTGFDPALNGGKPVQLVRLDGTPVRPEDVSVGGQITVFPGIPGGTTNEYADSPTLLIHLRAADAAVLQANLASIAVNAPTAQRPEGGMWGNFVAYSKICTHAGCPASLYEQQSNRLLCPCHQSQFLITDNARPIFGPATRRLPMLPLSVENGFFVAASDYAVPVGPAFWERP